MKLRLWTFDLPLKHVFRISRGAVSVQSVLLVELEHQSQFGYGEATTSRYYNQSIEDMASLVRTVKGQVESLKPDLRNPEWPAGAWAELDPKLSQSRFAQCAVDEAMWDLFGKLRGEKLHQIWRADPANAPSSDYTIGIDEIGVMRQKLREFADWPIFKIKLGAANDAEILRAMRQETSAALRIDANCGWTPESARELIPLCQSYGVEFIEQPFEASQTASMRELKAWSPLPLIADESCVVETDVAACVGQFHGINIKLTKCGGLTPARRMIAKARELGLSVMLGCMTESSVGISALAQLAPFADAADMDGAMLLAKDLCDGVRIHQGKVQFPDRNGTGVKLLAPLEEMGGREITL